MNSELFLVVGVVLGMLFTELTGISPGGLIVPGYIALFWNQPARIALTAAIAIATMFAIKFLSRWMLLFGRRRYALFLLVGFTIRAGAQLILPSLFPALGGLEAVGWLVPGIIASDIDKQGAPKTFLALGAVAALVRLVDLVVL
ncbi:MAG: poly-gamma-glutamate biosynthesis protein PgsC [Spirochaetales bacterium]|nr:MAG: poly-gamma-glutamate biosynthesis protein PgsC [Spirochaetales bacterium]